jgi:hypothetical protein
MTSQEFLSKFSSLQKELKSLAPSHRSDRDFLTLLVHLKEYGQINSIQYTKLQSFLFLANEIYAAPNLNVGDIPEQYKKDMDLVLKQIKQRMR